MGLFEEKKKQTLKTLEERAKEKGIEIKQDSFNPGNDYSVANLRGIAGTKEDAEDHLLEKAKGEGVVYLSDLTYGPKWVGYPNPEKFQMVEARAYRPLDAA